MKKQYSGKRQMLIIDRNPKAPLTDKTFFRLILTSVLGILLCCVCLASLTWAWFSTSVQSSFNNITTAQFYVTAKVSANGETVAKTSDESDIYTLKYALDTNKSYTVKLTAQGNASQFGGYCEITLSGDDNIDSIVRHTVQLYPSISQIETISDHPTKISEITITVNSSDTLNTLTIKPTWGEYTAESSEELLSNDSIIGEPITQESAQPQAQSVAAATTTVSSQTTAQPQTSAASTTTKATEITTTAPEQAEVSSEPTAAKTTTISE